MLGGSDKTLCAGSRRSNDQGWHWSSRGGDDVAESDGPVRRIIPTWGKKVLLDLICHGVG